MNSARPSTYTLTLPGRHAEDEGQVLVERDEEQQWKGRHQDTATIPSVLAQGNLSQL